MKQRKFFFELYVLLQNNHPYWALKIIVQVRELTYHLFQLLMEKSVGIFILMALWLVQMGIC